MNRHNRWITILVVLVLAVTSLGIFASCERQIFVPASQGSKVMTIDNQDISTPITTTYDSYNEFATSEYASMHLDDFDFKAKKSFYSRAFFKTRRLIAVKFNDSSNAKYLIRDISIEGNEYTVKIDKILDTTKKDDIRSYACFLEVPTKDKVKGAKVNLLMNRHVATPMSMGESITSSDDPLIATMIRSASELDSYKKQVNKKTREVLATFDSAFFAKNYLLTVDIIAHKDCVFTTELLSDERAFNITAYSSNHYRRKSDKMTRQVRFIAMPLGFSPKKVSITMYLESDFGIAEKSTRHEVELPDSPLLPFNE